MAPKYSFGSDSLSEKNKVCSSENVLRKSTFVHPNCILAQLVPLSPSQFCLIHVCVSEVHLKISKKKKIRLFAFDRAPENIVEIVVCLILQQIFLRNPIKISSTNPHLWLRYYLRKYS